MLEIGTLASVFDREGTDPSHGIDVKLYSMSVKLTIDLSPAQTERLGQEAERLGLVPEELARAAIADLLATPDAEFKRAAERVLRKNEELYRRLA